MDSSEFDISRIAKSDFNMDQICFQEYKNQFSVHGNNRDPQCAVKCRLTGVIPWSLENREPYADHDREGQTDYENGLDEVENLTTFAKWGLKQLKRKIDYCEEVIVEQNKKIEELQNTIQELIKAAVQVEVV